MDWFVLQLIIVILAPWALKYIRQAQHIHTSFTEIFALITILTLVLTVMTSGLDKLSPQEQLEELNKNIINLTDWLNSNLIIIVFKIIISEVLGVISGALTYLIGWLAKRRRNIHW